MPKVKKRTVISSTNSFQMVKQERPGKKTWYEISYRNPDWGRLTWAEEEQLNNEILDFFTTMSANGVDKARFEISWKFWKYDQANNAFLMAALKFET